MSIPCIVIRRHTAGLYEWATCYQDERVDGDIGDASIAGCLSSAVSAVAEPNGLVEIRYRGVHMGTFSRTRVLEDPEGIAEQIVNTYGNHVQTIL